MHFPQLSLEETQRQAKEQHFPGRLHLNLLKKQNKHLDAPAFPAVLGADLPAFKMLEQSFSLPHSLISLGCVRVCVSHNETTQSPSECRVARNVLVTFRSVAVVSQHPRELASSAVVSVDKLGAHSCARVAVQYHSCHQHLIEMKHSSRDVLPLAISRISSAQSGVTGSGVGSIPAGCVTAAMAFFLQKQCDLTALDRERKYYIFLLGAGHYTWNPL